QGQAGAYGCWLRVSVKPIDLAVAPDVSRLKLWRIEDVTFDRVRQNNAMRVLEARLASYAGAPVGLLSVEKDTLATVFNDRLAASLRFGDHARSRGLRLSDLAADGGAHLLASPAATQDFPAHRVVLVLTRENGQGCPATLLVPPEGDRLS